MRIYNNLDDAGEHGLSRFALRALDEPITINLPVGEVRFGRRRDSDVLLLDGTVAKLHARLEVARDSLRINDMGSTNGAFIGAVRVAGTAELQVGDTLYVGGIGFVVEVAKWLDPALPGEMIVIPDASAEPVAGWNDEAWAASFLAWRDDVVRHASPATTQRPP